jgi:DNA ligase-1
MADHSVQAFAAANDAAAATTKKLEKSTILATYFKSVPDEHLADAVRFAGGKAFGATDDRVLGISSAAFRDVIVEMYDVTPDDWRARVVKNGETGEGLASLWKDKGPPETGEETLTLGDLREAFDAFATVTQNQTKRDLLRDLLVRCTEPRTVAYVGKIIGGDLRSGAREGVLQAAVAEAFEAEANKVRRATLLVGDLGDIAMLAKAHRLDEARFRLFHPIGFMLATPQETPDDAAATIAKSERTWTAEHKLDGVRAQIHKTGVGDLARVSIYSRTLDRVDAAWPDVVEQVRQIPGSWLLDGEIVADNGQGGIGPFANVQRRLGRDDPPASILRQFPAKFVPFDLLYRDDRVLIDEPTDLRRREMLDLLAASTTEPLDATEVTDVASIDAAFAASREARNEGLILKDPISPYLPGRRGRGWLKLKTHLPTLDVVVVAAEYGHGKRRDSLSDYTFAVWTSDPAEDGRLVVIGKVFSGVTDEEIAQLTEHFLATQTNQRGKVFDVKPTTVFEVAFDAIQESQRHEGGFALRFPRIKRIRHDRSPESADRISRVREIFEHEQNFNRVAPAKAASPQLTLFGE